MSEDLFRNIIQQQQQGPRIPGAAEGQNAKDRARIERSPVRFFDWDRRRLFGD